MSAVQEIVECGHRLVECGVRHGTRSAWLLRCSCGYAVTTTAGGLSLYELQDVFEEHPCAVAGLCRWSGLGS